MNKLALATSISAILASPVFATDYTTVASSGTAANPLAGITVQAGTATSVFYVDNASGTASNTAAQAIQLVKSGNWTFDFTNPSAVTFTGNIAYGDYKTQTNVTGTPTIDGRQTYVGVNQAFSGTGTLSGDTFTFNFSNPTVNGGGASVQTQTSSSCANGKTNIVGKVCNSFATASPAWEGLALNFVFSADRSTFSGTLTGTDTSGSGLTANTATINWQIAGTGDAAPAVPVPAAAWLFGSGLLGLATTARRRAKAK